MNSRPQRAAFVTGGGRGIGYAIAEILAERGDAVTIADIDLERAQESCADLVAKGLTARAVAVDVSDAALIAKAVADADRVSPLTTVVCNAGIGIETGVLDTAEGDYDRLMAVNLKGVFFTMQAALRQMVVRGTGSVVAISSTSGFTASSTPMAAYDASKAAVRMLTLAAAREVAACGVRVNAVAPGTVGTELVRELLSPEAIDRLTRERIPIGRLADPREIATAVAFLSSEDASYITGHTIVADGGWLT